MRIVNTGMRISERDDAITECISLCASALSDLEKQAKSAGGDLAANVIRSIDPAVMNAITGAAGACVAEQICMRLYDMLSPAVRERAEAMCQENMNQQSKGAAGNS